MALSKLSGWDWQTFIQNVPESPSAVVKQEINYHFWLKQIQFGSNRAHGESEGCEDENAIYCRID